MNSTNNTQKGTVFTVAMLFLFMFLNFADKAILGLTAIPIMQELGLTPKQFGLIGSSFFFLYAVATILVGFLVNRIDTKWPLFIMCLVWSLAQFSVIAGSAGLMTLIIARVVLGAGEGPAFPVAMHSAYKWFPNEKRALPSSIIAQGAPIGVLIALPALGWVITHYAWRDSYAVLGVAGIIWCLVWAVWGREGKVAVTAKAAAASTSAIERVPYSRLLLNPTVLGNAITEFGAYWGLSLLIAWFPPYLIAGLGLPASTAHVVAAVPWAVNAACIVGLSWYSQRLLKRGVSSRMARGVLGAACVSIGGLALAAMPYVDGLWPKVLMVTIGISIPSVIYVLGPAILSEITPVKQRGGVLAINNATVTSAGLIAPYLTGSVIQSAATQSEGYVQGFFICGVITLVAGVIGMVFIRPEAELRRYEAAARRDTGSAPTTEALAR